MTQLEDGFEGSTNFSAPDTSTPPPPEKNTECFDRYDNWKTLGWVNLFFHPINTIIMSIITFYGTYHLFYPIRTFYFNKNSTPQIILLCSLWFAWLYIIAFFFQFCLFPATGVSDDCSRTLGTILSGWIGERISLYMFFLARSPTLREKTKLCIVRSAL